MEKVPVETTRMISEGESTTVSTRPDSPPVSESFVRTFILIPTSSLADLTLEGALIAYSMSRKLPSGGTKEREDDCSNLESLRENETSQRAYLHCKRMER